MHQGLQERWCWQTSSYLSDPDASNTYPTIRQRTGDYKAGWPEYDRIADTDPKTRYHFAQPRWDGTVQKEATLLLHAQHGFGDTLWFARYLSLVRERVGRLILACPPELVRLMEQCPALDAVLTQDRKAGVIYDLPPFDTYINLMSLPVVFDTCPNTIPIAMPWLYVPQESSERWRSFFAPFMGRKIGIVWAGSDNGFRSCSLADFSSLARVPDVTLFSLQKGPMASALATAPLNGSVIDLGPQLFDFAETAAALQHLDLLISIDTAVVHLAGALGKPVWTLMTSSPGWVWGREGSDSLWYPTMRLFRQSPGQDWNDVLQEVADALCCAATIS